MSHEMRKLLLLLMFFGVIISPVYVFKSGLPQPTDFILISFALSAYFYAFFHPSGNPVFVLPHTWLYLVVWVVFVVLVWTLLMQSFDFLRDAFFWLYNFLIVSSIIYFMRLSPSYRQVFEKAIGIALVISALGVIFSFGISIRPTGFFNNPNQLAFYSLCALGILQVMNKGAIKMTPWGLITFLSGVIGIFGAASLAAMVGFFLLPMAHLIAANSAIKFVKTIFGVLIVTSLVLFIDSPVKTYVFENVEARLQKAEKKVNDISEERNYDRIIAFPEYMIFGAGEAHLERFKPYDHLEIHSSFGNLLFSYGVLGLGLFLMLIYKIGRNASLPVLVIMMAPLLYSFTHMGLRTTVFWVFLGIVWFESYYRVNLRVN